ncbi:hypothetical protein ACQ33O_05380 [Ferruginibacter sp. SUN002]|uniref:hypothetical protein n=1 Tax=Ferruginibacter sp. SUN002 TaxID=2937789 RepID=UPI003D36F773
MNWKAFITVCVSAFFVSFPQNIIGCGGGDDPYDYYTSFFHQNLPDAAGYKPFYYTGINFLFDETEPTDVSDVLADEWANYCGNGVKNDDAKRFVNKFSRDVIATLYNKIEKNTKNIIPDSVLKNSMSNYFIKTKDLEGLGYILYARQVEPFVVGSYDYWEPIERDSVKMAKLIKNGTQLYNASKKTFFKLKYAYQIQRLALYSGRNEDAIKFYDDYVSVTKSESVLQQLCIALKAGGLFRTGRQKEAAYFYSKAFSGSTVKRISNYLGFKWSINSEDNRNDYLSFCKNDKEKADMLALFAMSSSYDDELKTIQTIYTLNPASTALEVLVVREINKLEDKYFTPNIQLEKGGKTFYYYYTSDETKINVDKKGTEAILLSKFLHEAAQNPKVKNRGLFEAAAAHAAYITKEYANAKEYLSAAQKLNCTEKVKDQLALTNLLVTISEKQTIDAAFEEQLLPSIEWLAKKAKAEKPIQIDYYELGQWKKFYRDLMCEILARKYHAQNDLGKEALCIGAADRMTYGNDQVINYGNGIDFVRGSLNSTEAEKLFTLFISSKQNAFEKYLLSHNSIKKETVVDHLGTAYLREYDYTNAIAWYKKCTDKESLKITTDPFIDLLYDQEEALAHEAKFSTTKLAFAEEMLRLTKLISTDKKNAAKYYYKIATGMYNMTYYGHAWKLVEYNRSGSDGYYIPKDANAFEKQYYGCFAAEENFKKALNASSDKNFKARCLFMMAKCSQKQEHQPQYEEYGYNDWDKMDTARKEYEISFKRNRYFPQFVKDYKGTAFYAEAFNSCSYLRDFVGKK